MHGLAKKLETMGIDNISNTLDIDCVTLRQYLEKKQIPAELVIPIARMLRWEYTPHQLRPDIYPNPDDGLPKDVFDSLPEVDQVEFFGRRKRGDIEVGLYALAAQASTGALKGISYSAIYCEQKGVTREGALGASRYNLYLAHYGASRLAAGLRSMIKRSS